MKYDVDESVVADVKVPHQSHVKFINIIITQMGDMYELWIKWGTHLYLIANGDLNEMNAKKERLSRFIHDPLAPEIPSLKEFARMARGV